MFPFARARQCGAAAFELNSRTHQQCVISAGGVPRGNANTRPSARDNRVSVRRIDIAMRNGGLTQPVDPSAGSRTHDGVGPICASRAAASRRRSTEALIAMCVYICWTKDDHQLSRH